VNVTSPLGADTKIARGASPRPCRRFPGKGTMGWSDGCHNHAIDSGAKMGNSTLSILMNLTRWFAVIAVVMSIAACKKEEVVVVQEPEPTPVPATPTPPPAATPTPRPLAPPGTFYVIKYFTVESDGGLSGIKPGTKVKLIKDGNEVVRVSDGAIEFDARKEYLTNDLETASLVARHDINSQAQLRQRMAIEGAAAQTPVSSGSSLGDQVRELEKQQELLRLQLSQLQRQSGSLGYVDREKAKTSANEQSRLQQQQRLEAQIDAVQNKIRQSGDQVNVLRMQMR